jgi:hypothetical protein
MFKALTLSGSSARILLQILLASAFLPWLKLRTAALSSAATSIFFGPVFKQIYSLAGYLPAQQ